MYAFLNPGGELLKTPSGIIAIAALAVLAAVITTLAMGTLTVPAAVDGAKLRSDTPFAYQHGGSLR